MDVVPSVKPRLAGLPLGRSGVAFELNRPARENTRVLIGSWLVSTAKNSAVLVARGRVSSYETAVRAALPRAEHALDKMSVRGIDDLLLAKADDEHVVWWPSSYGTTLRIVSTSFQTMGVMNLRATVRDAAGHIVKQPKPPKVPWHESYRFFRLSQTTLDLFDAYRNAYLALESILADRTPQRRKSPGRKGETEGEWFQRALDATGLDLSQFVKVSPGSEAAALYDAIYRGVRVRLFHAKPNRGSFLPRDRRAAGRVRQGLEMTRRVHLAIIEATLGMGRLGGGFSTYAVQGMAAAVFGGLAFMATSDETKLGTEATVVSPSGEPAVLLPNVEPAEYEGFIARRRAWATTADLRSLPFIRRIVGVGAEAAPYMTARLEGRLEHQGIGRLEVEFRLVARNARDLQSDHA